MGRIFLCALLISGAAWADCEKDSDCKSGRACVAGKCVDRKSCFKDADCPGDLVCESSQCVTPSGPPPGWGSAPKKAAPPAATGWGTVREQEAAAGAGMALRYTKNTWPIAVVDRPLVVAPGMTEANLSLSRDISNANGHPTAAGIYARYGVSDRIHAGIDALGFCFSDCGDFFQYLTVGAGYAVIADRDQNLVPWVGTGIYNSPGGLFLPLQALFLYGYRVNGSFQIAASGGLALGVIGRSNTASPDIFQITVQPRFQVLPQLAVGPILGFGLPFANTDFYSVPLGLGAIFVADRAVDIGAQFVFDNVISHTINTPFGSFSTGGFDQRTLTIFGTIRI
jgi:hypothetical protein